MIYEFLVYFLPNIDKLTDFFIATYYFGSDLETKIQSTFASQKHRLRGHWTANVKFTKVVHTFHNLVFPPFELYETGKMVIIIPRGK